MDMKNEATAGETYPEHMRRSGGRCEASSTAAHPSAVMYRNGTLLLDCPSCAQTLCPAMFRASA